MSAGIKDDYNDSNEQKGSGTAAKGRRSLRRTPKESKAPKVKLSRQERRAAKAAKKEQRPVKMSRKERRAAGISYKEYRARRKAQKQRGKLKIIIILVFVLLLALFVAEEVFFNFLGTRDVVINTVMKLDPEVRSRGAALNVRAKELDSRERSLDERETALLAEEDALAKWVEEWKKALESKEAQLDRRSAQLDKREKEVTDRELRATPVFRRQLTEEERQELESLSRSYSQIPPETAAEIFEKFQHKEDVAAIMYYMIERNAAAILAVMEPEFAAEITAILMHR